VSIEGYEERIDELEQELHDLQGDVISGNHLPPGVRVLSMKENPAQQWADLSKAAMDQLRGENQALLERLAELEKNGVRSEGGSDRAELVPRESWEILKQEKEALESTVKDKEKRLLRLQQVISLHLLSLSLPIRATMTNVYITSRSLVPKAQNSGRPSPPS
jgi:mitotic spindle assembly checkpoint protein MAD1